MTNAGKLLIVSMLACGVWVRAAEPRWEVAPTTWLEEGLGNHRAVARVDTPTAAVVATIPWRRQERDAAGTQVRVFTAAGQEISNVQWLAGDRETGMLAFAAPVAGDYYFYYRPYKRPLGYFDDPGTYFPAKATADPAWLRLHGLDAEGVKAKRWQALPRATVTAIQARDAFQALHPMGVIATAAETTTLLATYPTAAYLVFPEDRRFPISMIHDLPRKWIQSGPLPRFAGFAQQDEWYPFQLGVFAARRELKNLRLEFSELRNAAGAVIPASAFRCFNQGGTDYTGQPLHKVVNVPQGQVQAMWAMVDVPPVAEGTYTGELRVLADGVPATTVAVRLDVAVPRLTDHGVNELWRLSRLRWLDSNISRDDTVIPPFTPLVISGDHVEMLQRKIVFGKNGLPTSIQSNGRELLAQPLRFHVEDQNGEISFVPQAADRVLTATAAELQREAASIADGLVMNVHSTTEFDGYLLFEVRLKAERQLTLRNVGLDLEMPKAVAPYMMGLGKRGASRSAEPWPWRWDVARSDNMVWLGDWNAGLQLKLCPDNDRWTMMVDELRTTGLPASWSNGGKGGAVVQERGANVSLRAWSGDRTLVAGEELTFRFRLLVTPAKPYAKRRWSERQNHADGIGGTIGHIHHCWPSNLWINYPFLEPDALRERIAKAPGGKCYVYYSQRELSNRCVELQALRSLKGEVLNNDRILVYLDDKAVYQEPGGGHPWLREHLGSGYVPGWRQPVEGGLEIDAAVGTNAASRWDNYYIAGLGWLMQRTGMDGLYLDGVAYGRITMQRAARVMNANNPNYRIEAHIGNLYDYCDRRVSGLNLYLEVAPYLTNLWVGEGIDFDQAKPDFWLTEISGVPFGIGNDMLHYAGANPWKGMVFGMTGLHKDAALAAKGLWVEWDRFGIQDAQWLGWWNATCPVRTGREDVLATVYRKPGESLLAIGSWAETDTAVRLKIDWAALGLDPQHVRIVAPAIEHFQAAAEFKVGAPIPVKAQRGWLLRLQAVPASPPEVKKP